MSPQSATARLRKTFRYPGDGDEGHDSDDSLPEIMDEQEQESLITTLHTRNTASNVTTTRILLLLPLLSTLPFLLSFISSSFPTHTPLLTLLSLSSLSATLYLLHSLPPERTGISFLDSHSLKSRVPYHGGPLHEYLPYLNAGLAVLAALNGWLEKKTGRGGENAGLVGMLPAVVYGVVVCAKVTMASVDPESELKRLRYGYKGA